MKVVLQRVSQASVTIDSKIVADIQKGLLVLHEMNSGKTIASYLFYKNFPTRNLIVFATDHAIPPLNAILSLIL